MAAATGQTQPESAATPAQEQAGDVVRAELPAGLTSAREARAVVRQALAAWGIEDPDRDGELLASEVVANAAEHGRGPIRLSLRRDPEDPAGITCEVTDTS
ncbi:MAG: ATP-binding protein, partial [Streptosporangiaceae bacterium]